MNSETIVHRRGGLIEAEVDGELVALHVDNGACYGFNTTATRIWALIESPKRIGDIRDTLMSEYDVDAATCERELDMLLGELEKDGLVELRPE